MTGDRRQSGYTLIELLVVMVVLAVVVSIALTSIWNAFERAKQRATMADMRTVARAVELYQSDHGILPQTARGIQDLKTLLVPYQSSVIPTRDHWGHDLKYEADGIRGSYTIQSFGKDGIDGPDITLATRLVFSADIVLSNGQFVAAPE
jgi:general secretion pathway protein G